MTNSCANEAGTDRTACQRQAVLGVWVVWKVWVVMSELNVSVTYKIAIPAET